MAVSTLKDLVTKIHPNNVSLKYKCMNWLWEKTILSANNNKAVEINGIILSLSRKKETNLSI